MTRGLFDGFSARCRALGARCVARGLPPRWLGYRCVPRETVPQHVARRGRDAAVGWQLVHPEEVACNPLPRNVAERDDLPGDRGWWGYSFRDVPARLSGETFVATLPDCLVTWYRDSSRGGDFYPAILTGDGRALDLREIRFRPPHAAALRRAGTPVHVDRATWILERVYHNHSHWLTAHLPKLLMLRERHALAGVLLPQSRSAAIDDSIRLTGMDPSTFRTFEPDRPLAIGALTIVGTDRFRPELLRLVPRAARVPAAPCAGRRVFISRSKVTRRRLVNEDELWPHLARAGFERVHMEDLSFPDQVALMHETAVLLAPHGAGLTNMLFCPRGAHIVELADPTFPNPNFYALASAMRHRYWVLPAEALGDGHPLEKDLRIEVARVVAVLRRLEAVHQYA